MEMSLTLLDVTLWMFKTKGVVLKMSMKTLAKPESK